MKKTHESRGGEGFLPKWSVTIPVVSETPPGEEQTFAWELDIPLTLEYSGQNFSFTG